MLAIESTTWVKALAFGLFLLMAGVAASAQASLFYLNRNRLRGLIDGGLPRGQAIVKAFDEPTGLFSLILVLGTLGTVGSVGSALLLALELEIDWPWGWIGATIGGVLALLLVQGAARTLAVARPEGTALALARPLRMMAAPLAPLVVPLQSLERRGLRLLGLTGASEPLNAAQEELRVLVDLEDRSTLEEDEREMIHGIFEMSERPAREVMRPRIDMVAESKDGTVRHVLERVVASGHSRIPIYEDSVDNVVGVVYAKDLLKHLREGSMDDPVAPIARPPYFVPETKKVDELLRDLQQKRTHLAIVVDEYGGTAGLLTIEDLLEEIVGEIQDEHDEHEEQLMQVVSEREAVVDARTPLRDVNEAFDLHLDVDEFDTLGGLVYHELGKVPVEGDEVRVNGCLVTVLSTQGRRLKKLRLTLVEGAA